MLPETTNSDLTMDTSQAASRRDSHPADIDECVLEYQPIMALQSGALRGLASVLRRRRPGAGPSDGWALVHACVEARFWPGCRMSVTVPARLLGRDLLDHVAAALRISGLPPGNLDVELIDTSQFDAASPMFGVLQALRERGVGVVLGEFGIDAGPSLLRTLPLTAVKLDRSLVHGLPLGAGACAAARVALSAAHTMGLLVIADGVETLAQRNFLSQIGCDEAQGSLYSRPLPPHHLAALLDYGVDTCPAPRSTSETRYDRSVPH